MKILLVAVSACRIAVSVKRINLTILLGLLFFSLQACSSEDTETVTQQGIRIIPDDLFGVDFFDQQHGLISGYYGTVMKTSDAGQHWQHIDTGSRQLLRRIDMVSVDVAWAVGHRGGILKTVDGGSSWQIQAKKTDQYLRDVDFFDEQVGWIVGHEATILFTDDGGKHWRAQKLSGYQGRDLPRLNGIVAIDRTSAIVVGEFGVIAKTTDSGERWELVEHSAKNTLTAVEWSVDHAVAVGLDGYGCQIDIYGDAPITVIDTGSSNHLFDISLNAQGIGHAVGRAVILDYSDGVFIQSQVSDALELAYKWYGGVYSSDNFGTWAVGQRGEVIRLAVNTGAAENDNAGEFTVVSRLGSQPAGSSSPTIREKKHVR